MRGGFSARFSLPGTLLILGLAWPAQARLNLPQRPHTATLSEKDRRTLESAWAYASPGHPPAMTVPLQELLVDELPKETRNACGEIVEHWGTVAEGTARWTTRWLDSVRDNGRLTVAFVYRCGSSYPEYAKTYYDERLGVLTLEPGSASLELVPVGEDCDNCSDLYHVQFSQALPLAGGHLFELVVSTSSDNPCCDGPSQWREERLLYLLLPEGQPALSFDRVSEHYYHDDEEGDSETICRGEARFARDPSGRLTEIVAETSCRENDKPTPIQTRRYLWNPANRRLDEIPATKP